MSTIEAAALATRSPAVVGSVRSGRIRRSSSTALTAASAAPVSLRKWARCP
ncbi:hypothetical protein [Nocardioides sp. TF02-7]|uniref:hypothetical protein n=1 Tax=Nocardioides sp. TF02-7 TaxID=2917724 RepID=UPI0023DB8D66|nr:hypothetical protein [Nocardioides sp. TF02-7]